jgi:hypothetical protein
MAAVSVRAGVINVVIFPSDEVVVGAKLEHQIGAIHHQQRDGSQATQQQDLHKTTAGKIHPEHGRQFAATETCT